MTEKEDSEPVWQQFKPDSQVKDPIKLEVKGTIPDWVEGSLYRNGSGVFEIGGSKMKHLFDGMSVIIRFIIKDGEVKFQSRILESDAWNKSHKANRLVIDQFGTNAIPDPCKSIFSRVFSFFTPQTMTDNTAVNIIETGDQLWALTETTKINQVDCNTLGRIKKIDVDKYLAIHMATAHPHIDSDGTLFNLATNFNPVSAYNIIKIPPLPNGNMDLSKTELVASAPSRWMSSIGYNHSFGMSENYFIILEQPYVFSLTRLMGRKFTGATFCECFVAYPEEKAVFHIIKRDGQRVDIKYVMDPFFVFHYCNCYEKDGQLVIDVVMYKDVSAVDKLYLKNLQGQGVLNLKSEPVFGRFVLPLDISKAKIKENLITIDTEAKAVLQDNGNVFCTPDLIIEGGVIMELPQINYKNNNGKDYQYVYGAGVFNENNMISKLDVKNRSVKQYKELNDGCLPGEPIFLPKPTAINEDEGILLVPIINKKPGNASSLLILDAETMTEVARAILPVDVIMTLTFHGTFTNKEN